jgi:hypothetical protein
MGPIVFLHGVTFIVLSGAHAAGTNTPKRRSTPPLLVTLPNGDNQIVETVTNAAGGVVGTATTRVVLEGK